MNSAITKRRQELKRLTEEHSSILKNLKHSTNWMKGTLVIYSIKQQQNNIMQENERKTLKET